MTDREQVKEIAADSRWGFAVEVIYASMPTTGPAPLVLRWIDTIEALVVADRAVFEGRTSQPTDDREGWLEVPDYRGGGVMGRRRVAPTDDRVREAAQKMVEAFGDRHWMTEKEQQAIERARAALSPSAPDKEQA